MDYVAVTVNKNYSEDDVRFSAYIVEASSLQLARKKARIALRSPFYPDSIIDVMNRKTFITHLLVVNTYGSGFSNIRWKLKENFPSLFEDMRGTYLKKNTIPREKMAMMETEISRSLPKLPTKFL